MKKIEVKINNEKILTLDYGTKVLDFINENYLEEKYNILAVKVNNILVDLNYVLEEDCNLEFIYYGSKLGEAVYKQSTKFLFFVAVNEYFKNAKKQVKVFINHSLGNGYYFYINTKINKQIVKEIEELMWKLQSSALPFVFKRSAIHKAINYFEKKGYKDKVLLLKNSTYQFVKIYECRNVSDFAFIPIVPDTSYIKNFKLSYYEPGIILHFQDAKNIKKFAPDWEYKKLFKIYQESKNWSEILNLYNIGLLNQAIIDDKINEVINICETFHEKKISYIADMITKKRDKVKIILVAGPSSSGKTTFAKRLGIHLKVNGLNPIAISTDDFFVNRPLTPRDEKGDYDFESIYALDLKHFNQVLKNLLNGEEVWMPEFDFKEGKRNDKAYQLKLDKNQVIIIEGLHSLNPLLTKEIDNKYKFKIYVSALTQLTIDNFNRISTRDLRLIRRMVRDNFFRGYSADETISRWSSVTAGEEKYIYPFQESADIMFNSSLLYELGVLKDFAIDIIKRIPLDSPNYDEAQRLLNFLLLFLRVRTDNVPKTSILREFIGGGIL